MKKSKENKRRNQGKKKEKDMTVRNQRGKIKNAKERQITNDVHQK